MSTFGDNLKKFRTERNLTLEELAEGINAKYGDQGAKFSKGMLSKYEKGTDTNIKNANFIAGYFGVSLDDLIGMDFIENDKVAEPHGVYKVNGEIPIVGTIAAGTPIFAEQNILGYAPAPPMVNVDNKKVFYLQIKGESMNREFTNGSLVLIDKDTDVKNGDIAAVMVNSEDATVKKVYTQDNFLTLIPLSHDDSFVPETIDLKTEEVTIIGKVIGAFRQY